MAQAEQNEGDCIAKQFYRSISDEDILTLMKHKREPRNMKYLEYGYGFRLLKKNIRKYSRSHESFWILMKTWQGQILMYINLEMCCFTSSTPKLIIVR